MIGALTTAISGMMAAQSRADRAIADIVSNAADSLAESLVDLKVSEASFKANLQSLDAAIEQSRMLGKLFDRQV